jgi:hypothetical protein
MIIVPKSNAFNQERIMSLDSKAMATAKNIEVGRLPT